MELNKKFTYAKAGVDSEKGETVLKHLLKWTIKTKDFRTGLGSVKLESGYFANVLEIGPNLGLAISTDGVGTKILIAQLLNKYDTIGIDCIAMNVNDILCVGAEPISMVDYLAVQDTKPGLKPDLLEEIGKGLYEGAKIAKINIPGGELAQLREMISGVRSNCGFDLAGTCVGLVPLDKIIIGQNVEEGDTILGLRSNGIHSNGLTLARKVLLETKTGFNLDKYIPDLGRTLGEELLEPTHIYVPEIMEILNSGVKVKALIHITGDGFLNLNRVERKDLGFIIDFLPEPHPIFSLIQRLGRVDDEEMFKVFNMGIGFCIIFAEKEIEKCKDILKKCGVESYKLGYVVKDEERKVIVEPKKLVGKDNKFCLNSSMRLR